MADALMLEPSEIFVARMKAAYLGKEVDWALRFADGHEEPSGDVRVLFRSRPNELHYVAVTVPRGNYPWLAAMRRGQPVQVARLHHRDWQPIHRAEKCHADAPRRCGLLRDTSGVM